MNDCFEGCIHAHDYDDDDGVYCLHPDAPYYCECDRIREDDPIPDYCPIKKEVIDGEI